MKKLNSEQTYTLNSFYKRVIFSMIFLGLISAGVIVSIQKNNFYETLENDIKATVDINIKHYPNILKNKSHGLLKIDLEKEMSIHF